MTGKGKVSWSTPVLRNESKSESPEAAGKVTRSPYIPDVHGVSRCTCRGESGGVMYWRRVFLSEVMIDPRQTTLVSRLCRDGLRHFEGNKKGSAGRLCCRHAALS
ncbi:hypothetical protein O3P69_010568 [Scylla paramamosain]|uniref:Uncharacterized protein n=1 Tax=Scylla paramamosain TaxID=85552 RepID=A0AAW0TFH3_SCYPA